MFNYTSFSHQLRIERTQRGLTIESLSHLTGIPAIILNGYESQSQIISITELVILADIFNISLDYLLGLSQVREINK